MPDVFAASVTESRYRRRRGLDAWYGTVELAVLLTTNSALLYLNSHWFLLEGTVRFKSYGLQLYMRKSLSAIVLGMSGPNETLNWLLLEFGGSFTS